MLRSYYGMGLSFTFDCRQCCFFRCNNISLILIDRSLWTFNTIMRHKMKIRVDRGTCSMWYVKGLSMCVLINDEIQIFVAITTLLLYWFLNMGVCLGELFSGIAKYPRTKLLTRNCIYRFCMRDSLVQNVEFLLHYNSCWQYCLPKVIPVRIAFTLIGSTSISNWWKSVLWRFGPYATKPVSAYITKKIQMDHLLFKIVISFQRI